MHTKTSVVSRCQRVKTHLPRLVAEGVATSLPVVSLPFAMSHMELFV